MCAILFVNPKVSFRRLQEGEISDCVVQGQEQETYAISMHQNFDQCNSCMSAIILLPAWQVSMAPLWWFLWWQLWNFSVVHLKFNSILHLNEPPKRIFWYLVRPFDWGLSKIGLFQFSESILEAKIQLDLPENDFFTWILN